MKEKMFTDGVENNTSEQEVYNPLKETKWN